LLISDPSRWVRAITLPRSRSIALNPRIHSAAASPNPPRVTIAIVAETHHTNTPTTAGTTFGISHISSGRSMI
jgi:hypothetical protein